MPQPRLQGSKVILDGLALTRAFAGSNYIHLPEKLGDRNFQSQGNSLDTIQRNIASLSFDMRQERAVHLRLIG